jgi:DNA-binding MarR family transcriptional regulator
MSETFRQRADGLRARAALERDPGRQRYLRGLARSYEELARQHDEPEPSKRSKPPSASTRMERANLMALLRDEGHSQRRIAERLGVSQQTVSKTLLQGCHD